ncbi:MAG: hypothetical protein HQL15_08760, partial [Candidatus Omnitrophica bacterium]|nr:hypothetical protein [Candidatus Omnitrophota bacterium]
MSRKQTLSILWIIGIFLAVVIAMYMMKKPIDPMYGLRKVQEQPKMSVQETAAEPVAGAVSLKESLAAPQEPALPAMREISRVNEAVTTASVDQNALEKKLEGVVVANPTPTDEQLK